MKSLSKLKQIFFTLLFLSISFFAISQIQINPLYLGELNLTDNQKAELLDLELDKEKQIEKLRKEIRGTDKAQRIDGRENIKTINQTYNEKSMMVLTQEQKELLENFKTDIELESDKYSIVRFPEKMENEYPGIQATYEQGLQVEVINEEIRNSVDDNGRSWKEIHKAEKETYRKVLDDRQYAIYTSIENAKKAEQEKEMLEIIRKAYPVAEKMLPMLDEFTWTKAKVLRNKLEAKIDDKDKEIIEEIRLQRKAEFERLVYEEAMPEFDEFDFQNEELKRYATFFKDLLLDNVELISNGYPGDGFFMHKFNQEKDQNYLIFQKYLPEIKKYEAELLWLMKETIKKGAVIASEEFPIPPVSLILNEIKEVPDEMRYLFLLLDPEADFDIDLPNFNEGKGEHFANAFPNPATENQTLEFYLKQNADVTVDIIDEAGRVVKPLLSNNLDKGKQTLNVNLSDLSSKIYFYRITENGVVTTLKFSLVK